MTKRKDGLYQEVLKINGKTKYFYGKTKAEVLRKVRIYEEEQERGKLFKNVADEWWAFHENTIAHNTTKSYKPAYRRAVELFGEVPIKDILPSQINAVIEKFSQNRADKTVRTQLMVYNLIFRYAVQKGYALFNPVRDLTVPKNLPKKKRSSPSSQDIKRVKENTDIPFGMFAFWALYTGLRRGELMALEWKDVDVKNRTITVNKSLYHINNKPAIKLPKTKTSIGVVPILDALAEKIKPGKGLVFPNEQGEYITDTQFKYMWRKYCQTTGITATPHQFRHAYATMLFENDIPPEEAQALLRHAQLSTTMDIYTDLREDKLKSIHKKVYSVDIS
ncbi:MAG: tyrosine-type recombinase/integrase [Oscillospiraceae bacterium]|nr:tyrosine-type recombinase/integrase [Oscillospiraceae bacterium]MBQ8338536.1 tyrosine-type recombinase/integrase [Oscillospiraceae bacterium]